MIEARQPITVLTSAFGANDNTLPMIADSTARYMVVTDQPGVGGSGWEAMQITPLSTRNPRRLSRDPKMRPWLYTDSSWIIWLDGRVKLRLPASEIIKRVLEMAPEADIWAHRHRCRQDVYEEAAYLLRRPGSFNERSWSEQVVAQIREYAENRLTSETGLYELGFMVWRINDRTRLFGEEWHRLYLLGCERDQLSFPQAVRNVKCEIKQLPGDINNNSLFVVGRTAWSSSARALGSQAIVATTDGQLAVTNPNLFSFCRNRLKAQAAIAHMPIIEVANPPGAERSVRQMLKNILYALGRTGVDYIWIAEHDVLYPDGYFDDALSGDNCLTYAPPTDVYYLNRLGYRLRQERNAPFSTLAGSRDLLMRAVADKLAFPRVRFVEPGLEDNYTNRLQWRASHGAIIDIRHEGNISGYRAGVQLAADPAGCLPMEQLWAAIDNSNACSTKSEPVLVSPPGPTSVPDSKEEAPAAPVADLAVSTRRLRVLIVVDSDDQCYATTMQELVAHMPQYDLHIMSAQLYLTTIITSENYDLVYFRGWWGSMHRQPFIPWITTITTDGRPAETRLVTTKMTENTMLKAVVVQSLSVQKVALHARLPAVALIPNGINVKTYHPGFVGEQVVGLAARMEASTRVVPKGQDLLLVAGRDMGMRVAVINSMPHKDTADWYRSLWAYCQPSEREGCSNSVFEAMATGLPCLICKDVGYHGETCRDARTDANGEVLFVERNVPSIKEALQRLRDDPELYKRVSANARRFAVAHAWPVIAKRFDDLFRWAVDGKA